MPEAEEVLIDVARHATVAAQGVWRRLREERDQSPRRALLADYKPRLTLLIEAVLGLRPAIRVAQPPAPVSWLARRLRRQAAPAGDLPLPANDGQAIYLPPVIELEPDLADTQEYPLLALLQALRCARGSVACLAYRDSALVTDLLLLAEATAADHALRRLLPGWRAALDAFYARVATGLAAQRPRTAIQAEVMALHRSLLENRAATAAPLTATPQDALAWARAVARELAGRYPGERYGAFLADPVSGRLLPPEGSPSATRHAVESPPAAMPSPPKRAALARRPRVRAAEPDEDDETPGVWMVQTSEPLEHAEDSFGLNRPEDREADSDVQGVAESLAELESARLVSTPGQARATLHSDDPAPRLPRDGAAEPARGAIEYPEWDWRAGAYQARAVTLHQARAPEGAAAWAEATLAKRQGMLREVRRRFGALRPQRQTRNRLADGEDIDSDALIEERCERRAGLTPAGNLYQSRRPTSRRVGLLLLLDASGSTDAWVAEGQRVIDVEKEAALVAACALDTARIDFALLTFSGEGARGVQLGRIKDFAERWDEAAMRRLAAIEPDRFTRLGAPLRHASALLARQAVDLRLLLLLSDGKPNDCDRYASRYGLEDARQALIEARLQHIDPYCFTVDREASEYLPYLFGMGHYTIVQHAQQLPLAFIDWLRAAARRALR